LTDFSRLLDSFAGLRIALIGDLMLDEYVWGHIERISPEAPVPILNIVSRSSTLGGAGNVAANLLSLGVQVSVFGLVGSDETGRQVLDLLAACGADIRGVLTDSRRKSTRKTRLMSVEHSQQVFRLDEESTAPLDETIEHQLVTQIVAMATDIRTIICSDYLKGVLSSRVLASTFEIARKSGIRSIVAPKDNDLEKYRGADILMPNARELKQLSARSGLSLDDAALVLTDRLPLEALVVTRGSEGMSLFQKSAEGLRRVDISTAARSVFDVTGAGDTAIAGFAAAVAAGANLESAVHLANIAAGIKVGKRGTSSVTLQEIRSALRYDNIGAGN
jgi:D-beta-D-heptose 7-phosphate kinase / D-beta-D-heptose 1-phosphate adenosyltransferase